VKVLALAVALIAAGADGAALRAPLKLTLDGVAGARPGMSAAQVAEGGRQYFVRRARPPHWELRFDVSSAKRVTPIVFGEHRSVRLDEGCA